MQLSDRFLNLVQQQLDCYGDEQRLAKLVVYIARSRDQQAPSLEAVVLWPETGHTLPPVEADPELRAPSPDRRWFPLQDGQKLLGVLRAEQLAGPGWSAPLERRLQATAAALTGFLSLELERIKLLGTLDSQRDQIKLMVHQLRNPLAAIRTYTQLLLRRLGSDSDQQTLLEGLMSEQTQLDRYISALDQIGQINLPTQPNSGERLLLPPLLCRADNPSMKDILSPLIERAKASASLQGRHWQGPSKWPAWTQTERPQSDGVIAEVVANLLENAFRYSKAGAPVGLHLLDQGLCVWDGGTPIPREEREQIFSRGMRGKSSENLPGSGLGLTLGRQLSEQLGGSLQLTFSPAALDANYPDAGNVFSLLIPATTETEATG
ncbi:MAG: sensor histidine kinase [Prochlorococcus sp.]|nr:HAMP domain-containing sensor histidine kinase [Prochlorococcaceae cyanobacterium Fu_MAG_50]